MTKWDGDFAGNPAGYPADSNPYLHKCHHSGPFYGRRRVGPFWDRRDEWHCLYCGVAVPYPPEFARVIPGAPDRQERNVAKSTHYRDAEGLMALADKAAVEAVEAADGNPMLAIPGMASALVYLLGAQTHATLAVADALREKASQ
jgi:hypothetical protein